MSSDATRARLAGGAAVLGALVVAAAGCQVEPTSTEPEPRAGSEVRDPRNGSEAPESRIPSPGAEAVGGAYEHVVAFAEIGATHGNRASGEPGYEASRDYVVSRLERAGYWPVVQTFEYPYFQPLGDASVELTDPDDVTLVQGEDFSLMTYSGAGRASGTVTGVDLALDTPAASDSGCEASDFAEFPDGDIALLQRGGCPFGQKVGHAEDAGAVAAIVSNQGDSTDEGRQELFLGDLRGPVAIPAVTVSFPTAQDLARTSPDATIVTDTVSEVRTTWNVLAETEDGSADNVVMAGAHLDSVEAGPGINDNASGSAALLETAEELATADQRPANRIRFAWWGAEELRLLGSRYYVNDLMANDPEAFREVALYLNADMVASPNYMLGVYDGDRSESEGGSGSPPPGAGAIEEAFTRFFDDHGTGSVQTRLTASSDHAPFVMQGVPAGGIFTGTGEPKTSEAASMFGGTAGEPYDPCYHAECDGLDNVSREALAANTAALLAVVTELGQSTEAVNGDATGHEPPATGLRVREDRAPLAPHYRGNFY
ncbi:M28 family metallopeptidase [Nocardioides sp. GXQ0305]|uniref:M28 family metallopeptidase n=1 Tax=Nocardioides sp. GXQ0305 TaxID=3423912 RepID=UPI003D7F1282